MRSFHIHHILQTLNNYLVASHVLRLYDECVIIEKKGLHIV